MARLASLKPRIGILDTRIAKPPPKTADPFYSSAAWRSLMAEIIAERGRRCEDPEHDNAERAKRMGNR